MTDPTPPPPATRQRPVGSRRVPERWVFAVAAVLYVGWTFVVSRGWTGRIDAAFAARALPPRSTFGQLAEAFALLTHPAVVIVVTVVLAVRSYRDRQRRLALALTVAGLGIPVWVFQQIVYPRARPQSLFEDSLSVDPISSYPSGHIVAITILVWIISTIANAHRRSDASQWRLRVVGIGLIGLVGVDQWAMGTAWGSDLVGGLLLGITVASGALWLSAVGSIIRPWRPAPGELSGKQAAVVFNPTKVLDLELFHRRVDFALTRSGWRSTLWLPTARDDSGTGMTRAALDAGVDLVLVAGGDGTVRAVCAELAGSAVPVGLLPAGTGNLLCRNLGIPLDEDEAIDVALRGEPTSIDMVRWTTDGASWMFAVMAGVGLDAQIMRDTSAQLKKVVRAGAYVVAAAQQVRMPAFRATVIVDGVVRHDAPAMTALIGNVGRLQGGFELIHGASPTDGMLDVLVASGESLRGFARAAALLKTGGGDSPLTRARGRKVEVVLDRPVAFQLDGDTLGETQRFTAEAMPGALVVMLP